MDKKKKSTWTSRIVWGMFSLAIILFLLLFVGHVRQKLGNMVMGIVSIDAEPGGTKEPADNGQLPTPPDED